MLKRLDKKIRFRGHRRDDSLDLDLDQSPSTSDNECGDDPARTGSPTRDPEDLLDSDTPPLTDAQAGAGAMAAEVQDFQRLEADRLTEVKGHLEIALLEKHFLEEELRRLREEAGVEALKQEVEKERCKRLDVETRLNQLIKTRSEDPPPPLLPNATPPQADGTEPQRETVFSRLRRSWSERVSSHLEDFHFQPEEVVTETEEPLSAKRLTENMRRLKRGLKPVTNFKRNLAALSSWFSVYTSGIAFIVYMNAAWYGWVIPVFLFLAILRLSLNYLISRGWRIQWSIVPQVSDSLDPPKDDLTVSEKFQLVLDVAQKAQNLFGKMADILEKIKNLFMWVQPQMTQKLYVGLWLAFIASCLLPYDLLGFIIGLYAGIKFFIIDFLYKSCPKLRAKYDTPYIIWTSLPTDPQLKDRGAPPLHRRTPSTASRSYRATSPPPGPGREEEGGRNNSKKGAFHEVFNLDEKERPLAVCENGWRCCLINRDRKTPSDYIRNGVLYVTENFLCFESSSSRSSAYKKNKVIALLDITDIQKYKVLSVLPGSGMGISIATPSTQKPMVFGAMIHRDEAFEAIFSQYSKTLTATSDP
ncbi:GRAM domain-containing protein 4-like isoform X1 [Gadus chalcogrammus]|uniref:GRAM domain-containing protein 4-like isoform X1 n=1 Tax=Gadus chalcogrammus TaxID=1042646 RepID=UPI0024C48DD9|nr:GRAM domain-containing protein 4-like isoform X1 [Gadus chalcogrammus]XP_056454316.1 GRAM domain-containing protein 4-like isoform X1 [Gadus chalcogrammus]XP_056454317.1 GRAM domain-containing protein 4-like isoform X1 [Gadus chalcogrammus]XP_056454318.1 GRAM domain-containing protein 4-like isoform X1 [Gadus chalcogrammus]